MLVVPHLVRTQNPRGVISIISGLAWKAEPAHQPSLVSGRILALLEIPPWSQAPLGDDQDAPSCITFKVAGTVPTPAAPRPAKAPFRTRPLPFFTCSERE